MTVWCSEFENKITDRQMSHLAVDAKKLCPVRSFWKGNVDSLLHAANERIVKAVWVVGGADK